VAEPQWLRHSAVTLALHELRPGVLGSSDAAARRPLLLVHALGEATPAEAPDFTAPWPGPVYGLDFTGHGRSTIPHGGGYSAEVLMGDVDVALAALGPSTIVGRGVGAYVALLTAGARPKLVRGAVLCDGPGLAGGGVGPSSSALLSIDPDAPAPPDPWALAEMARDVRPPDYATSFARQALQFSGVSWPFAVCAQWRPPWLEAVAAEPGVLDVDLDEAIAFYRNVE
jgi:pimeloyl-ACP methyl ester carboxylesterase